MEQPAASNKRAKVEEQDMTPSTSTTREPRIHRPLLHGDALKLPLRWLVAKDAARSERTCRYWQQEISTAYDMWRDIAVNTSSELVVRSVLASEVGADLVSEGPTPTFNFRRLAAGLSQRFPKEDKKVELPEPTLKPEDLFFLVEVQQAHPDKGNAKTRETVAVYCCTDCSAWFDSRVGVLMALEDMDQPFFSVKGENPLADLKEHIANSYLPCYEDMFDDILRYSDELFVKITLFRRDDGRSICLVDGAGLNEVREPTFGDTKGRHGKLEDFVSCADYVGYDCPTPRLFASNKSGSVARMLMSLRNITNMDFDICLEFRPDLSSPHNMGWVRSLVDCVWRGHPARPPWTEQDKEELSRISHFSHQLTHIIVTPRCAESPDSCCNGYFSKKDLLLILEGFDWK